MIHSDTTTQLQAHSFDPNNDNSYTTSLDEDSNTMGSCNYPDAIRSGTLCKHMFLVNRIGRIGFPELQPHLSNAITRGKKITLCSFTTIVLS